MDTEKQLAGPPYDRCRCPDDSGSCDYCQALFLGEINKDGYWTEYGLSLIEADKNNS